MHAEIAAVAWNMVEEMKNTKWFWMSPILQSPQKLSWRQKKVTQFESVKNSRSDFSFLSRMTRNWFMKISRTKVQVNVRTAYNGCDITLII